jgi:hypothetical protein
MNSEKIQKQKNNIMIKYIRISTEPQEVFREFRCQKIMGYIFIYLFIYIYIYTDGVQLLR